MMKTKNPPILQIANNCISESILNLISLVIYDLQKFIFRNFWVCVFLEVALRFEQFFFFLSSVSFAYELFPALKINGYARMNDT